MDTASSPAVRGSVSHGRGWLARHWTAIAGLSMFVLAAVADALAVVDPGRDWFGLFAWGAFAGFLVVLWLRQRFEPEVRPSADVRPGLARS